MRMRLLRFGGIFLAASLALCPAGCDDHDSDAGFVDFSGVLYVDVFNATADVAKIEFYDGDPLFHNRTGDTMEPGAHVKIKLFFSDGLGEVRARKENDSTFYRLQAYVDDELKIRDGDF